MKKINLLIVAALIALQGLLFVPFALANQNLISNESVESASAGQPSNWQFNRWGSNTATASYSADAHTGSRALGVTMSAHTDGDAKWLHDAVGVAPNTEYTYSSWYKSSVTTEIDLQYKKTDGSFSYAFAKIVPAASDWTQVTTNFTTPSDVASVRVMHIVYTAGSLMTDDFSLTTAVEPVPDPDPVPVDNDNLIANGSFEEGSAAPVGWAKNAWGTNANNFTYNSNGRTGNRSVTTTISSISSGDAKWYAAPAEVIAGKTYQYSDYYKSGVTTRVVAAFINGSGAYSYNELLQASPATNWAKYAATFTVPEGTQKVSIYHVIDRVGSLTIDDAALTVAVPPSTTSLVPNPSLEAADGNKPADWVASQWGTNNPTYAYEANGHTGNRSVKVTMSGYQSGDAKWYFDPISLTENQQYRFSAWFKGNVTPHPVVMFLMKDGSEQYFGMPIPANNPSSTTWQKYSDTFSVPVGAAKVSVFFYINQNGWLQTDDYSIDSYHAEGFNRALLSLTFDDGHEDNTATALPLLNQYGFKTTQCYATQFIEGQSQAVKNGVLAFRDAGHEICSHTVTHPFLSQLSTSNVDYELSHSKAYLEQLTGQPIRNFASPYGDYSPSVVNEITKYYGSHRSVDEGYNSKDNFNVYNLRVQNILDTTTADEVAAWIANAQADNTWLILVYHRVANNPGPYDTTPSLFKAHLQRIAGSGITVKTMNDALTEVKSQL